MNKKIYIQEEIICTQFCFYYYCFLTQKKMKIAEYNCFLVQATFALCQTNVYKRVRSTNKTSLEKQIKSSK